MTRLSFEGCRIGALILATGPFAATDPASVWLRAAGFIWMFIVVCDVGALSTLWYLREEYQSERDYALVIADAIPAFVLGFFWCLAWALGIQFFLGFAPWQDWHILRFFLAGAYLFPFLTGKVWPFLWSALWKWLDRYKPARF